VAVLDDDPIIFAADDEVREGPHPQALPPWRILVVDDEPEIHAVTRLTLSKLEIDGHPLEILSAHTGDAARQLLECSEDIALVLLDVVMESENAGLALARWIREEHRDPLIRIVLRTGQPGTAPEHQVMLDYDINDYRPKTDLTAQRLITTVLGAIRSYRDLRLISAQKRGLQRVVDASATLFKRIPAREFLSGLVEQIAALLSPRESTMFVQIRGPFFGVGDESTLLAGTGRFRSAAGEPIARLLDADACRDMELAIRERRTVHGPNYSIFGLCYRARSWAAVYIDTTSPLSTWENHLLEVLCHNATVALDNLRLHHRQLDLVDAFERFVPKRLLDLAGISDVARARVGDHIQREVSVVFADLRSFTSLAETLSPSATFSFINNFFAAIVPAIHAYGGVVDKYMGDGLMALFPSSPADAVRAGLGMIEATRRIAEQYRDSVPQTPRIGVGIHMGPIILGLVGAADRLDFTGISDGVNVAARIERLTRSVHADILISQPIFAGLPTELAALCRPLGELTIRGKDRRVEIHEVFATDPAGERARKAATAGPLSIISATLKEQRWQEAQKMLAALRVQHQGDHAIQVIEKHCARQIALDGDGA